MHRLIETARQQNRHLLEPEALAVLSDYRVTVPPHRMTRTAAEAQAAARELDGPVILKVVSPDIIHKTDVGGVVLNVHGDAAVAAAFDRLAALGRDGRRIEGVLVTPLQPHDVELCVGMVRDPQFGPVMTFGLGGIWIEVFKDIAYGIAPLSPDEAQEMIASVRAHAILQGARTGVALDIGALRDLLVATARLVMTEDAIQEIDLNPVFPLEEGCFIADARIIL